MPRVIPSVPTKTNEVARPDTFFGEAQQRRLGELMDRWRTARDSGVELPQDEQTELDALVEEELQATARRTTAILNDVTQ